MLFSKIYFTICTAISSVKTGVLNLVSPFLIVIILEPAGPDFGSKKEA
jgi:hypothetical protein